MGWRILDTKKGNLRMRISEAGMKALQKNIDDGFIDFITGKPYEFTLPKRDLKNIELLYKAEDISREKHDMMVKTLTEGLLDEGDNYQGKGNWIPDENGNKFDLEEHGVPGPFFAPTEDGMKHLDSLGIIEKIRKECFRQELLESGTYKSLDDETKILYITYYCSGSVGNFVTFVGDYRLYSFRPSS